MKLKLFIILVFIGIACHAQVTPSKIVKVSSSTVTFTENLPSGTLLINIGTGKQYISLVPLSSAKTIGTCVLDTDIREVGASSDEIQDLSLSGNTLSLTDDGTAVDLSSFKDNTDSQNLSNGGRTGTTQTIAISGGTSVSFDVADGDNSATNELNSSMAWDSGTKTISVTDAGGTKSVAISGFLQSEVDGDATNELQDLSVTDKTLFISSGNSVDLSALGGATNLDGLSDVKFGGTNFTDGLLIGHTTTGTLSDSRANLGIMDGALSSLTSGDWNMGIGPSALRNVTTGFLNVGIGNYSFMALTTQLGNVGVGPNTGNKSTGSYNTAIGMDAMANHLGTATENVAIGQKALANNISTSSTIIKNVALGSMAGFDSNGDGNTYLGYQAGRKSSSATTTVDDNNIYLGYQAGMNVTGSNNIILGTGTYPSLNNYPFSPDDIPVFNNKLLVGYQATPLITGDLGTASNGSARSITLYGTTKISDAYTLPTTTGTNAQVLTTDGNGGTSWADAGGSGAAHYVGDLYRGGIICWVDDTGEHGLICALNDCVVSYNSDFAWEGITDTSIRTMSYGDGTYSGEMNTILILTTYRYGTDNTMYAARICAELEVVGDDGTTYGDWYLPSKGELALINISRSWIDTLASMNGGDIFKNKKYWSSTEDSAYSLPYAWAYDFTLSNSKPLQWPKSEKLKVRAIRAF